MAKLSVKSLAVITMGLQAAHKLIRVEKGEKDEIPVGRSVGVAGKNVCVFCILQLL